ncbi:sigma-70 family RNA polymerase sigma factor [Aquimarina aquimarini]|uniref:sigma-70 family RNA polymerase sigma factor n=1 Tax=Aquimarina aquimarini TaxID=1191734 RepID=UPI000D55D6F6|nr:sigma-70 family RNA polymerase sigma factor [Aquimarina aquimarini]
METIHFWETYQDDIRIFIKSKVKNDHITDDLVQETFIKVHNKKDTLKDESKIKSWLFTIARNTVYDFFKETKQQTIEIVEESTYEEINIEPEHSEKDCLPGLINALPQKYRVPLFLSDIKGYKQEQIAEQLQLPISTVKSQIQRARKLIVKGYMECCNYTMNNKGKLVGETKSKENCKICNKKKH